MAHSRLYSFVIDPRGEFLFQAKKLIWSLTTFIKTDPKNIVAHVAGESDACVWQELRELGVSVEKVTPYSGHPWCNKLQQLPSLRQYSFDDVVLLDCDIVVLEDLPVNPEHIQAKPVDTSNPPLNILTKIFSAADLPMALALSTVTRQETAWANANGGVYVIPKNSFNTLTEHWLKWAAWCMNMKDAFEDKWIHIDQVSFALAITSSGLGFTELDQSCNFPTHLELSEALDVAPKLLHYHRNVDEFLNLKPMKNQATINKKISEINTAWMKHLRTNAPAVSYWNSYYKGGASSGNSAANAMTDLRAKQESLQFIYYLTSPSHLLDLGAGDGTVTVCIHEKTDVTAVDYAIEARALYLKKLPSATWALHDIRYPYCPSRKCDLASCLDVLPNISSPDDYERILDSACALGSDLLISGYDAEPAEFGYLDFFHEPLSRSLEKRNRTWIPIVSYSGRIALFSPGNKKNRHPRDINHPTLQSAVPFVDSHAVLLEAIYKSRALLGFFPDHLPRCIEYPWILDNLPKGDGCRAIDAGAGVSVLPFMLADHGYDVLTVDSSSMVRLVDQKESWNEWGYLDYQTIDPRITSLNIPYEKLELSEKIDVIVSVSVVEHLPAATRREWFRTARRQLKEDGVLLITVDTVPHSINLWNYNGGIRVEEPADHGDLIQMRQELVEAGFFVEGIEHVVWLPQSRVGMGKIRARLLPPEPAP